MNTCHETIIKSTNHQLLTITRSVRDGQDEDEPDDILDGQDESEAVGGQDGDEPDDILDGQDETDDNNQGEDETDDIDGQDEDDDVNQHEDRAGDEKGADTEDNVECYGFKIVGDNLDKYVKPRYMRVNKQAQSLNYFNCYAVKDRIDSSSLSSFKSSYKESVNVADILPYCKNTNNNLM